MPNPETEPLAALLTSQSESSQTFSAEDEPPLDLDPAAVEDLTKLGRVEEPPPKRTRTRKPSSSAPARRTTTSLERRLHDALGHVEHFPTDHPSLAGQAYYTGLAGAIFFMDQTDAYTVAAHSANVAHAWVMLAEENAKVKLILERALSGGAWGQAVLATLAMLLPIAANHGLIPGSVLSPLGPRPSEASQNGPEPGGSPAGAEGAVG
jgi:hypothetical protein